MKPGNKSISRLSWRSTHTPLEERGVSLAVLEAMTEYFDKKFVSDEESTTEFRVYGYKPNRAKGGHENETPVQMEAEARDADFRALTFVESADIAEVECSVPANSTASAKGQGGDRASSIWWLSEEKRTNLFTAMNNGHSKCKELLALANAKSKKLFGKPTVFVSHAWSMGWKTVIESLQQFVEVNKLSRSTTYFWLDVIAVNQHSEDDIDDRKERDRVRREFQEELKEMPLVVRKTEYLALVIHPFTKPTVLGRLWCWNEIAAALESDRMISLALCKESRGDLKKVLKELSGKSKSSSDKAKELQKTLKNLDCGKAKCTNDNDKGPILERLMSLSALGDTKDANWQMKRVIVDAILAEARKENPGYTSELMPLMEELALVFNPGTSQADVAAWCKLQIALAQQMFAKETKLEDAGKICKAVIAKLKELLQVYGLQTKPEHRAESTLDLATAYQTYAECAKGWKREEMDQALVNSKLALENTARARLIPDPFNLRDLADLAEPAATKRFSLRDPADPAITKRSPRFKKLELRTALLEARIFYYMGRVPLLYWECKFDNRSSSKPKNVWRKELFEAHAMLQKSLVLVLRLEAKYDPKTKGAPVLLDDDRKQLDFLKGDLYGTMAKFLGHRGIINQDLRLTDDPIFDEMRKFFEITIQLFEKHEDPRGLFYTMSRAYVYTGLKEFGAALKLLNSIREDMLTAAISGKARLGKFLSWGLYVKAAADGLGSTKKANKSDYLLNTLKTLASFAEKANARESKITPEEWECRELQQVHEWFDKLQGDFPEQAARWKEAFEKAK